MKITMNDSVSSKFILNIDKWLSANKCTAGDSRDSGLGRDTHI